MARLNKDQQSSSKRQSLSVLMQAEQHLMNEEQYEDTL